VGETRKSRRSSTSDLFLQHTIGRRLVLDGEMCSWDEAGEQYVPFGHNRGVTLEEGKEGRHLCFLAFDLIFYVSQREAAAAPITTTPGEEERGEEEEMNLIRT